LVIDITFPQLRANGKYVLQSMVLGMDLLGNSTFFVVGQKFAGDYKPRIAFDETSNRAYVNSSMYDFNLEEGLVRLNNVADGNNHLSNTINQILTDNVNLILMAGKPSFHQVLSRIMDGCLDPVVRNLPEQYGQELAQSVGCQERNEV